MARRMKRYRYREATYADQEMRTRIDAFMGGVTPTRKMIDESIAPLMRKLDGEAAHRMTVEEDADRRRRSMDRARGPAGKPNPAELAALRAYREAVRRRARPILAPPKVHAVPPQILSGSIFVFTSPPYSARWTAGTNAAANHLTGTWSVRSLQVSSSQVESSFAGVCKFFTPVRGRFNVRFAPYLPINYEYRIDAFTLDLPPSFVVTRASSSAFLGAYVTA